MNGLIALFHVPSTPRSLLRPSSVSPPWSPPWSSILLLVLLMQLSLAVLTEPRRRVVLAHVLGVVPKRDQLVVLVVKVDTGERKRAAWRSVDVTDVGHSYESWRVGNESRGWIYQVVASCHRRIPPPTTAQTLPTIVHCPVTAAFLSTRAPSHSTLHV